MTREEVKATALVTAGGTLLVLAASLSQKPRWAGVGLGTMGVGIAAEFAKQEMI